MHDLTDRIIEGSLKNGAGVAIHLCDGEVEIYIGGWFLGSIDHTDISKQVGHEIELPQDVLDICYD